MTLIVVMTVIWRYLAELGIFGVNNVKVIEV